MLILDLINSLDGSVGVHIFVNLLLNLSKVLGDILISLLELFLGIFSNFSGDHALLVFEKAVGSTKEAIQSYNLLQESKFGVRVTLLVLFILFLELNGLLDSFVNLGIDFCVGKGADGVVSFGTFTRFSEGRRNKIGDFLDM